MSNLMTYEDLLVYAQNKGLNIKEKKLKFNFKGLYKNSRILINSDIDTDIERKCILIEEIGHHETSFGNIIDYNNLNSKKQELRARRWANEKLIEIKDLICAYNYGVKNKYELADFLGVTEEFLNDTIINYRKKYGICYQIESYLIYFEPNLGILKLV
ncbi:ImmA/IrrE family metallo-endopeptidase [Clostridium botulinum]|uniref:ImmA/IrrE family metallo-endopeptidase n=1 Tax=Clostridium botulinum TaxID=1491 RepID=UPI001F623AA1|nr:ImmA/IrrE family metallo-endopeptidase [Clostridium botulinum]MCR1157306.1 hypothetical protein [Clostridium botulinum]